MSDEFREVFADTLEVEEDVLLEGYVLEESEMWDSMTIVTVIALIDEHFGTTVEGEALAECKTYGEVMTIANGE